MRALRVVGILEEAGEFAVVLEDSERHERFTVKADEQLRAAARGDLSRLGQIAIEVESQLRPREIQARIRAGASVEQVAAMAGVPLQKIERFAYPVLLERSRTADVAQRAHPVRADGTDSRMLGDVVAHTFGVRGQDYTDVEWDSWKGEDGKWVVVLSWHAGHSDIRAHWTFQPGANGGTVTALDENASDLVEGLPARPLRPVGPVIDMSRPDNGGRQPAELAESAGWVSTDGPAPGPVQELRAAASDSGRRDYPAVERTSTRTAPEPRRPAPPTQRQAPAEPRTPEHRSAEPYQAQGYTSSPERRQADYQSEPRPEYRPVEHRPAERETADALPPAAPQPEPQARPEPARTESRATPEPAEVPEPAAPEPVAAAEPEAPVEARQPEPEPTPESEPAPETEPPAAEAAPAPEKSEPARPAAAKRTKKGKPVMPSWDEVLLGVRGPR